MDPNKDGPLQPVRIFALNSFRLDSDRWLDLETKETNAEVLNGFCSNQDRRQLFVHLQPDSGLCASLSFPPGVHTKVLCVSKTVPPQEESRTVLDLEEIEGGGGLSVLIGLTEEVACPLLSNTVSHSRWAGGVAQEALTVLERKRRAAMVIRAQLDGHTFLPLPDAVSHHSNGHNVNQTELKCLSSNRNLSEVELLHACEGTVVEWAELVSDFVHQDWSRQVLEGLKPLPSEEMDFWQNRLKNLLFLQNQLKSNKAQQVASILHAADSVYWSVLKDIYRDVQKGVQEVRDITEKLSPVQQMLAEVLEMDYQQLRTNMVAVMDEVRQLWIKSEFYCQPGRMVVLLQEICNLFIHLSRKFLRGQEVMCALVSDPGSVLGDIKLVIQTLQGLKKAYTQNQMMLYLWNQSQATPTHTWDFPSNLVFIHLDTFLKRLHSIQQVFCIILQWYQLDPIVLSGISGRIWTDVVQQVFQDFVVHMRLLSEYSCDPTDPEDQSFEKNLDRFKAQVSDLETRLVSVLNKALEERSEALHAAKLVRMFWFVLDHPLIQDQLHPVLKQLVKQVLVDLDQTELQFYSQRKNSEMFCRSGPVAAARLCWSRQLRRRTEDVLTSFRTIQNLCVDSAQSQLVLLKVRQIVKLLQDFRTTERSDWSSQLDSDCRLILNHPLIQFNPQAQVEVGRRRQVEAMLMELRYVNREGHVVLHPHAARFLSCRDDITQSYLSLDHMESCYNQVVGGVMEVELNLIQDHLQHLKQNLSELQENTWSSGGVMQQTEQVLSFYTNIRDARANMDTISRITQEWAELDLVQLSGDSLMEGGVINETCIRVKEEGQQLLRLTQVNRTLYRADEASLTWVKYLDHIDNKVQDGLFHLLLRALRYLSDSMSPQTGPLMTISVQLQETGSVFDPMVDGGLTDVFRTVVGHVYTAASLPPRISLRCHCNYQEVLQHHLELCEMEQEVMRKLLQVKEEAELLRAELDRYSHLWQSDRKAVFQEFLTYSRQLGPEDIEPEKTPPTLKDFQREIKVLQTLSSEVTHLDDVIILHGWLQVDLRPFTASLLSLIQDRKYMYTHFLLESASNSLQKEIQAVGDDDDDETSSFPLIETILVLEAAGVELPEHLAAQLKC